MYELSTSTLQSVNYSSIRNLSHQHWIYDEKANGVM